MWVASFTTHRNEAEWPRSTELGSVTKVVIVGGFGFGVGASATSTFDGAGGGVSTAVFFWQAMPDARRSTPIAPAAFPYFVICDLLKLLSASQGATTLATFQCLDRHKKEER